MQYERVAPEARPVILILPLLPVLLWTLGPPAWHPILAVIYITAFVIFAIKMVLNYRAGTLERQGTLADQVGWRWVPGLTPEGYMRRLVIFLNAHGWRIETSLVNDDGAVEMVLYQNSDAVALLIPGPAQVAPTAEAHARLSALRPRSKGSTAVLVLAARSRAKLPPASTGVMYIRFSDLEWLARVIHAGPLK
jgi:hypothetical protein